MQMTHAWMHLQPHFPLVLSPQMAQHPMKYPQHDWHQTTTLLQHNLPTMEQLLAKRNSPYNPPLSRRHNDFPSTCSTQNPCSQRRGMHDHLPYANTTTDQTNFPHPPTQTTRNVMIALETVVAKLLGMVNALVPGQSLVCGRDYSDEYRAMMFSPLGLEVNEPPL